MKDSHKKRIKVYAYVVGDLLHVGHLKFLETAKSCGDKLIVGVLTDKAAMEKKPAPIIPYEERVKMIAALKCVDEVVKQESYSPVNCHEKVKPHICIESISHKDKFCYKEAELVILPYYEGQSSTKIKQKIRGRKWA